MKDKLIQPITQIRRSMISGYGVFALTNIKKNQIIEECPFLSFDKIPLELKQYIFSLSDSESAIPLGHGCLYNHSELPNATWNIDETHQLMVFKALRNIDKDEEICIYYSDNWFAIHNIREKKPYYFSKNITTLLLRISVVLMIFFIVKMSLSSYHSTHKNNAIQNVSMRNHLS